MSNIIYKRGFPVGTGTTLTVSNRVGITRITIPELSFDPTNDLIIPSDVNGKWDIEIEVNSENGFTDLTIKRV